jgi:hypothetical protein
MDFDCSLSEISRKGKIIKMINKIIIIFWALVVTTMAFMNISNAQNMELSDDEYKQIILDFEKKDSPPNDIDFFSILSQIGNERLYKKTVLDLYQEIKKRQNSSITKEQLLKIVKSKQESLTSFMCKYQYIQERANVIEKEQVEYEVAFQKNKYFIEVKPITTTKKRIHFKKSYDGDKMINLMLDKNFPQAQISQDTSLNLFGELSSPFIASMLLNTSAYHLKNTYYDFLLFLKDPQTLVYGKKEKIDDCECIVLSNLQHRIYLDPKRDYSVVRKESYSNLFKLSGIDKKPVLVGAKLEVQTKFHDIENYGNGIWLPQYIETNVKDKSGNITKKEFIKTQYIKINEKIDDSYFTNIIPSNALVLDNTRKLVYKQSDSASIGSLLQETVKPKSTSIYNWISIIVGLIMIVIEIALEIRKRILKRRAS